MLQLKIYCTMQAVFGFSIKYICKMNESHFALLRPFELAEELGRRLQQQRLRQNISQAELARRIGVSVPTISNLENGKNATMDTFLNVVLALGLANELEALFAQTPLTSAELRRLHQQPKRQRASRKTDD